MKSAIKSKIGVCLVIGSAFALQACSKSSSDPNSNLMIARNIVSTRAQNTTHFMAVIKLTNPALLEEPQKLNGRAVIDKKLLAEITREQEETIKNLKELSGEVQVIFQYKMVLNAVAILAPIEISDKIKSLGNVVYTEKSGTFERPLTFELNNSVSNPPFAERNSAKFIGAENLNAAGITGKGVKVGIIDTGIDYTHAMFLGAGTEDAYKAVDPALANAGFPNSKVVGGIDLAGTAFDSGSPDFQKHIPKPDLNPLDEAGHGTHVAGTVSGLGDNVNTYNGMAPEADLHAIKVFGAEGSTSDLVVIAALEYSADPNGDAANEDLLDVVNLSLGSSYGNPHILYAEAIKNLVNGGTVVVASAGNSGHSDYIVGAPGTSDAALSVAASVDNGDHLWKFNASRFNLGADALLVEAIEAASTKKITDGGAVSGKIVYVGLAAVDLTDGEKAALNGNIALIDRGQVNFNDKVKRAVEGGAIGVVVANNKEGAPIVMGTTDKFQIPAIMITLSDATKVKDAMKLGAVSFDFKTDFKIEKPELIDTLTDFTSKGPRSVDGFIKPEISAPGSNVISAEMGGGNKAIQMSGTSMAAPHMSGVVALIRQVHKNLTAAEIKSLVMGTSKTIAENGNRYAVSLQGAGRVQADKAAESKFVILQTSLSLGEISIENKKVYRRQLTVKNISNEKQSLDFKFEGNGFITMAALPTLELKPLETTEVAVTLMLDATNMKEEKIREMDGWIKLFQSGAEVYRVPVLAIAHRLSSLEASRLVVSSTSQLDSAGALAELTLVSKNANAGEAQLFNLIGTDERKPRAESFMTSDCDLQAAGYRLHKDILQVAVKLYKPMTTWHACDISLLIDSDQDGIADQELLGAHLRSIPGQSTNDFATTLIDAVIARQLRKAYEQAVSEAKGIPELLAKLKSAETYTPALLDQAGLKLYNNSSVVILQISTKKLALTSAGALSFKLLVTHNEQSSVEFDDMLKTTVQADMRISLKPEDQAFLDLPEAVVLNQQGNKTLQVTKGEGNEKLMVLFPNNRFSLSNLHEDSQMQILAPEFTVK